MLLPYASDYTPSRRAWVTWSLIAAMGAMLAWVLLNARWQGPERAQEILAAFGLVPARFNPWTLLSYAFVHGDARHWLINAFYLLVFGAGVEEAVGWRRYLAMFFLASIVGGGAQVWVTQHVATGVPSNVPIVGASGACAGLIGLFAVRYYRARLRFVGLPFRPHVVAVVALFLIYEMGTGAWEWLHGTPGAGVAHWAHIGGFVFGLVAAQILRLDAQGQRAYLAQDATRASVPGAAIRRWEHILTREPDNAMARVELARAWMQMGDAEQAIPHYVQAIQTRLKEGHRSEAALLYGELRENVPGFAPATVFDTPQLFTLGNALEDVEQYTDATEVLRAVMVQSPDAPEAETALLKVVQLYVYRLNRREEAQILIRLFLDRYPHSSWRGMAEELRRVAATPVTD